MGNLENAFPQNSFVFLMVVGILVMLALALSFVLFFNYSQKKLLTEQMLNQKLAYEHQEALLHSTILTQEKERKRIARELHDEIGSKLNVILLNIHRLQSADETQETTAEISAEMTTLIHSTIDTTRRISHDLLPPTLEDFGLVEAIKELQHNFNKAGGSKVNFELMEAKTEVRNVDVQLNLFRIIQELINNSLRHGQASEIDIKLWINPEQLKLTYSDNGKGFDMNDFEHKKGLGLKNIESRLHILGGTHHYSSALGEGIKYELTLTAIS